MRPMERFLRINIIVHPGFEPGSSAPEADRIGHYPNGLIYLPTVIKSVGVILTSRYFYFSVANESKSFG